jgi:hypothetical protein
VLRRSPCIRVSSSNTPAEMLVQIAQLPACFNRSLFPSIGGLPHCLRGSASAFGTFGACVTFTEITTRGLATSPKAKCCHEGSDGFVTSTAAPLATGWSDRVSRAGIAPAEDRHLSSRREQSRGVARWFRCCQAGPAPFGWQCLTSVTVLRFHTPLIEPDGRFSRIRLSDQKSRVRPRKALRSLTQSYQTQLIVKVLVRE